MTSNNGLGAPKPTAQSLASIRAKEAELVYAAWITRRLNRADLLRNRAVAVATVAGIGTATTIAAATTADANSIGVAVLTGLTGLSFSVSLISALVALTKPTRKGAAPSASSEDLLGAVTQVHDLEEADILGAAKVATITAGISIILAVVSGVVLSLLLIPPPEATMHVYLDQPAIDRLKQACQPGDQLSPPFLVADRPSAAGFVTLAAPCPTREHVLLPSRHIQLIVTD